jgi:quercetin dioxygenase-like cupin family protein
MSLEHPSVRRWPAEAPPDEPLLRALLAEEGLEVFPWSNPPGELYAPHVHGYDKILYVVQGSISFGLTDGRVILEAGDRLELPAGIEHAAVVGPDGVQCLEGHR